ncbi:hypothetical protein BaRGS_00033611 [Batillaria attramentaria]|uniref:Uncharacterized protein n=1 Tax=Batillaria attramentaria TaxID=370345 RepID=A0ABD0JJK1_9CAEN
MLWPNDRICPKQIHTVVQAKTLRQLYSSPGADRHARPSVFMDLARRDQIQTAISLAVVLPHPLPTGGLFVRMWKYFARLRNLTPAAGPYELMRTQLETETDCRPVLIFAKGDATLTAGRVIPIYCPLLGICRASKDGFHRARQVVTLHRPCG